MGKTYTCNFSKHGVAKVMLLLYIRLRKLREETKLMKDKVTRDENHVKECRQLSQFIDNMIKENKEAITR